MRATAASLLRQTLAPAVRATRPTQLRASLRRLDGDHANRDPGIIPYWGLRKSPNIERWAVMRNHMDKHFEFTPIAIKTIIIGCIIFPAWVYYMTVDGVSYRNPARTNLQLEPDLVWPHKSDPEYKVWLKHYIIGDFQEWHAAKVAAEAEAADKE